MAFKFGVVSYSSYSGFCLIFFLFNSPSFVFLFFFFFLTVSFYSCFFPTGLPGTCTWNPIFAWTVTVAWTVDPHNWWVKFCLEHFLLSQIVVTLRNMLFYTYLLFLFPRSSKNKHCSSGWWSARLGTVSICLKISR